ncbi:MAG TPA: ABC transporter permease [Stellaceae bacterium]|nr:ABC transporter permease [Stellaceae bacterium]
MRRVISGAGWVYLAAVYVFVIGPVIFVTATSFNTATSFPAPFAGVTVKWYRAILAHPEFIDAAWTSALIASVSSAIATAVAFLAAYAMRRGGKRENTALSTILASPILVPQIVISLAMLQFASLLGLGGGLPSLIAVHTVYALPFALRLVMTGLARFNFGLEDAALSLGAGRLAIWRDITLPLLRPNLVAGFTFCFILSFVNLPISLFLTNAQTTTLPVVMFAYLEASIDPMLAAVATIVVAAACVATLILERFLHIRLVE